MAPLKAKVESLQLALKDGGSTALKLQVTAHSFSPSLSDPTSACSPCSTPCFFCMLRLLYAIFCHALHVASKCR